MLHDPLCGNSVGGHGRGKLANDESRGEVSAKELKNIKEDQADELADLFWKEQYSIHYHVWDQDHFKAFLAFLPTYLGDKWRLAQVDYASTMMDEFVYVLEKQ